MRKIASLALLTVLSACAGSPREPAAPAQPTEAAAAPATTAPAAIGAALGVVHVAEVQPSPAIRAVVDAADRSDKDRELDVGRRPAELLAFGLVGPGMHVADLGAGLGYTTELLARAVGQWGRGASFTAKITSSSSSALPTSPGASGWRSRH